MTAALHGDAVALSELWAPLLAEGVGELNPESAGWGVLSASRHFCPSQQPEELGLTVPMTEV